MIKPTGSKEGHLSRRYTIIKKSRTSKKKSERTLDPDDRFSENKKTLTEIKWM